MRANEELHLENFSPIIGNVALAERTGMDFAGFIDPGDKRWAAMLEKTRHDFYHLPRYSNLSGRHESGHPVAFYAEWDDSAMLIPLLIRKLPLNLEAPDNWCDLASPYGYPSPLFYSPSELVSPVPFLKALEEAAWSIDAVCGFFRFHPLLPVPREGLNEKGKLICHGQTVFIDLRMSEEEIRRDTRKNHRENIIRLEKEGFTAVMNDWSRWPEFIAVYHQTMARLQANSCYCFSNEYFEEFRSVLGSRAHLCSILSPEGEMAACGLITATEGIIQIHLAATATPYLDKAPSKLMFDAVRRWAQENGEKELHLGGGVGGSNDSLFRFKSGFSKCHADFHTYRMIFDSTRYNLLVREWMKSRTAQEVPCVPEDDFDGFFPLYRKQT
jgi:hypothetical protein